ncbi:class I SAM-dependent methyltransferase [Polynucleobacter asymbioticus]|uniref:class I SAM-dependent methyltransferase n=1 Tax=Polynucleobacter asymbioticus TaxID=576611 RepID=UPI0008F925A0|nr:class I SAM-dependent methyltransferase [Polynucleobacter asymbioticus]
MKLIERTYDVVTGSTDLEDLHSLPNFPVFMGSVTHDQIDDVVSDMSWSISRQSGLIQLKNLLPLDVLYQAQTTTSAVGQIWMAHHMAFAKFIAKYQPVSVLELGGAHGILAKEFQEIAEIPWTILEPNPSPIEGCNAKFIRGFFDEKFRFSDVVDTVVHSHVFEHIYEPDKFMSHLAGFIPAGGKMIFSIPNLSEWLVKKYTNCINFEHSIFLTEPYVDYLLAKHGFRIVEKTYYSDGHSIFYATTRDDAVEPIKLASQLYELNKNIYTDFVKYHSNLILDLHERLKGISSPIYLFGAHVFAQYLIAFGLDTSRVICLLDNDKGKQGKRLYGTSLFVRSPEILRDIEKPVVILKAGVYNSEIKKEILEKINDSVVFLE